MAVKDGYVRTPFAAAGFMFFSGNTIGEGPQNTCRDCCCLALLARVSQACWLPERPLHIHNFPVMHLTGSLSAFEVTGTHFHVSICR